MKTVSLFLLGSLGALSLALGQTQPPPPAPVAPVVHHGADGSVDAPDGFLRVKDATMYLKNHHLTRVNNELKLQEGIVARPSGEITFSNGQTIKLEEGQMVTLQGKRMPVPIGLGSTAPGSATTPPDTSTPSRPVPAPVK